MRCLVTGASGHLGSSLTRRLVQENCEVAIFVRPQSDLWRISDILPRVRVLYGDLSDSDSILSAVHSAVPQVVYHVAWSGIGAEQRNHPDQINCNLTGSLQLVKAALESGCRCWAGLGSQAEYGLYDDVLREESPTRPRNAYGVAKLCVGLLSQQLCKMANARSLWFRLFATYGPKEDIRHLIPMVISKLLNGEEPALTGGQQRWDYLYVDDAAEAIFQAAICSMAQGTYNLGSGTSYTVRSIVEMIRDRINPGLSLGFDQIPYYAHQIMRLEADVSRLRSDANWLPHVSLSEGLERTIAWYRDERTAHVP